MRSCDFEKPLNSASTKPISSKLLIIMPNDLISRDILQTYRIRYTLTAKDFGRFYFRTNLNPNI